MVAQVPKTGTPAFVPAPMHSTPPRSSAAPETPAAQSATPSPTGATPQASPEPATQPAPPPAPVTKPVFAAKPLVGLALFPDAASGLPVAIFRNRETGEVIEKIPSERVLQLYAQQKRLEDSGAQPNPTDTLDLKA